MTLHGSCGRLFATLLICKEQGSRALLFSITEIQMYPRGLTYQKEVLLQKACFLSSNKPLWVHLNLIGNSELEKHALVIQD